MSNQNQSDESAVSNDLTENNNVPVSLQPSSTANLLREEDIGVVFAYEPPANTAPQTQHSSGQNERRRQTRRTNHHGRRGTRHRNRTNHRRRQEENVFRSYAKHWISQCLATFLTGTIFMAIGIALIIMQLVTYIGIMFVLVSLPSFFMTIHMIRSRMRQRQLRRVYIERRQRRAIRRRQRATENAAFRGTALPYSDLPPAYDNLVFNGTGPDGAVDQDAENLSVSTISEDSEIPPPIYNDEWDKVSFLDEEFKESKNSDVALTLELKSPVLTEPTTETENFTTIQNPHCSYID